MKKKFKDRKIGKLLMKFTDVVVDLLPLGTTVRKGIKSIVQIGISGKGKESLDFDGDGKVEWHEIAIAVAGTAVTGYLVVSGALSFEDLKEILTLITSN